MHRSTSRAAALAAALALTGGLAACSSAGPETETELESLRVAVTPGQFDMNFTDIAHGGWTFYFPTQAVYEPLFTRSAETDGYVGWLASDFEIADDSLSMDVSLHDGVTFTDGSPLNAEGVVEVLQSAFTDENSWAKAAIGDLYGAEAEATGEYTLRISTTIPIRYIGFIEYFEFIPIVSAEWLGDDALAEERPAGTGPYLVDEIVPDVSISYTPNPDYWNEELPVWEGLELIVFDDQVAALNALKTGQVDATALEMSNAAEAEGAGLVVHEGQYVNDTIMIIDHEGVGTPALGDVRVRQAMNMAFDRESIAENFDKGYGRVSSQPFDPSHLEYVEGGDDRYPYDLEAARDLMAEAGYADGFTLRLPISPDSTSIAYQPIIEQSLSDIGITVEWVNYPDGAALNAATTALEVPATFNVRNFDTGVSTYDPGVGALGTIQPITDPEFVEMLEIYREGTLEEFEDVQPKLAEYILENALYVPYSQRPVLWATTPAVGMSFPQLGVSFPRLIDFAPAE
jgi:peptide/nickel transport system substrate-binding protein